MKEFIEKFQCIGCTNGSNTNCGMFKKHSSNEGCQSHSAGTFTMAGKILLGMPKGFNRLYQMPGERVITHIEFHPELTDQFNKFNVPVWKTRYEGAVLVRGMRPRLSAPFLMIFPELPEEKYNKIQCLEITPEEIEGMD